VQISYSRKGAKQNNKTTGRKAMTTTTTNHDKETIVMAIEVSDANWLLGFSNGEKKSIRNVKAWDIEHFEKEVEKAKTKLKVDGKAVIHCCYEAGRDGFGIHRYLESVGIHNNVIDPSSIDRDRRWKHKKTDRIDVKKMIELQEMRYYMDNKKYRVVRVPSVEAEDERRLHREWDRLKKERTGHINRIKSLLVMHGIKVKSVQSLDIVEIRDWANNPLPPMLREEIVREQERLALIEKQIHTIRQKREQRIKHPENRSDEIVCRLLMLKSIGPQISWTLVKEFFGWRTFKNRKQVGSLAGLTGCPYNSGTMNHEQGISKAGNCQVRTLAIELAWLWLRWQPNSKLSKWYNERFGDSGDRLRRIGIVALARKLLVALWKYIEFGIVPDGAVFKPVAK